MLWSSNTVGVHPQAAPYSSIDGTPGERAPRLEADARYIGNMNTRVQAGVANLPQGVGIGSVVMGNVIEESSLILRGREGA